MAKRTQAVGKSKGESKTKMKVYNSREARKVARKNGFEHEYTIGDHAHYRRGNQKLVIGRNLNRMIWERLVKENQLNLNV